MPSLPSELLWMLVTPDQIWGFVLISCRVFGCLQFAPLTSEASVPLRIRAVLACMIGGIVAAITPFQLSSFEHPLPLLVVLEFALGATLGLGATLILFGLRGAAELIDQQSGLAMARLLDPQSGEEASPHAPLLMSVGVAVFVLLAPIGGDLQLCGHLLGTFRTIPVGVGETSGIPALLTHALLGACELAIGGVAPILLLLSLLNWAVTLWQRAEPSMSHANWMNPVRFAVLWLLLCWTAGRLPATLQHTLDTHGPVAANIHDEARPR